MVDVPTPAAFTAASAADLAVMLDELRAAHAALDHAIAASSSGATAAELAATTPHDAADAQAIADRVVAAAATSSAEMFRALTESALALAKMVAKA